MEKAKNILHILLIILLVLSLVVIGVFAYYKLFDNDIIIGVNNIDNQVGLDVLETINAGNLSEEEIAKLEDRYFIHVNYYSNKKQNGIELQELQLNYFTDYGLLSNAYRSTGMQYVGDYQGLPLDTWDGNSEVKFLNLTGNNDRYYGVSEVSVNIANNYVDKSFNYFDSTNGISWGGVTNENGSIATELKRATNFIIKIDNRAFSICLDKYFDKDVGDVKNFAGIGWKIGEKYNRFYYTYGSLFQTCMQAVRRNSSGFGRYYITVDLSSLFTIREFDVNTGKFKEDNVTDIIKNYAVVKFDYFEQGATKASQSIFGSINYDTKYGETDIDTSYWQEKVVYTLTEKDLSYRYSEVYSGSLATLKVDILETLSKLENVEINVEIDTNSQYFEDNNINFVGFDFNAFEGVKLNNLVLNGSGTIKFLENSLKDTGLRKLIRSNAIVLDMDENAINSEFVGVVV